MISRWWWFSLWLSKWVNVMFYRLFVSTYWTYFLSHDCGIHTWCEVWWRIKTTFTKIKVCVSVFCLVVKRNRHLMSSFPRYTAVLHDCTLFHPKQWTAYIVICTLHIYSVFSVIADSDDIYTQTLLGNGQNDFRNKTALILGGGDGGLLNELLKHHPKYVLMVEISIF